MSTNNDPYSLDFLIPDHILELCQLDKFDLSIHLVATAANNQYPLIRVKINDKIIFDEQCRAVTEIHHLLTSKDPVQVTVEYYGRTDKDTVVDSEGNIVENQHLELTKIVVNDVDIVKNSIIYNLGNYTKNLSLEQIQYYSDHGIETGPTHSLSMYENGVWTLNFKMPILTQFAKFKAFEDDTEKSWVDNLNYKIFNTINIVRDLEKQIKTNDHNN